VRLVVLGGSASSTPELADALAAWRGGLDRRPELEVVLVGRSRDKLDLVGHEFRGRVGTTGPSLSVSVATNRREALAGADVVLNQVRIGGLDARVFDETFPWAFGLPGEETMGPGGFANAMRTVPALAATWDDIAGIAPGAFVVNLTNPAGIVQESVAAGWPSLKVVSICDAPEAFARLIATRLHRPVARVLGRYVGMNHCGFYIPESPDELPELAGLVSGMDPSVVAAFEALPTPYVRYYVEPALQLAGQRERKPRARELKEIDAALLSAYASGPNAERQRRGAVWYALVVVPLIDGWLHGSDLPIVLSVRNDYRLPEAAASATVEVAHRIWAGRLEALAAPPRPALVRLTLARHGTYETLATAAVRPDAGPEARLRAMLANPMVASLEQAAALLKEIEERSPRN
jgi:6-phospho-beta-glucosidase